MDKQLTKKVQDIVRNAVLLKNKYTDQIDVPVNYACIFSHSKKEYDALVKAVQIKATLLSATPSGLLYHIAPVQTIAGKLKILKIRLPDHSRPEAGDADFTIKNYATFKKKYVAQKGFKLIPREGFEMIELMDASFNVRTYFSNPPVDKQYHIK